MKTEALYRCIENADLKADAIEASAELLAMKCHMHDQKKLIESMGEKMKTMAEELTRIAEGGK